MSGITKPSITRLARRAGVKSSSDECFDTIRGLIRDKLDEVINVAMVVNSEHQTKTLMVENIYDALHLMNENVTHSMDLGKTTYIN